MLIRHGEKLVFNHRIHNTKTRKINITYIIYFIEIFLLQSVKKKCILYISQRVTELLRNQAELEDGLAVEIFTRSQHDTGKLVLQHTDDINQN